MADSDPGYGIPPAGFRLPAPTRVGRIRLQVADLERSLDWYGRVLGFEVSAPTERVSPPGAPHPFERGAAVGPPEAGALIELYERPGASAVERGSRLGLFHFAVLLPTRSDLGRFAAHLGSLREPVGAADHRVSEAFYLYDPDGLGVEVYADRPRSSWRHHDRQIEMTTEPLDVPDLVRLGGSGGWMGLPRGTTIGHVHLHVGDLQAAEAFYHDALGLDKMVWDYPGALFLAAGGYHHHLGVNTWAAGAVPAGEDEARLLEWELVVPTSEDASAAVTAAREAGGEVPVDEAVVGDPWGTALRVRAADTLYHPFP